MGVDDREMEPERRERSLRALLRAELVEVDPRRPQLNERAHQFFKLRRFSEFRRYLEAELNAWRRSPTAQHLTGLALYHEGDLDGSRGLVREAERMWLGFSTLEALSPSTTELIRTHMVCCNLRIDVARNDPAAAARRLDSRQQELLDRRDRDELDDVEFVTFSRRLWSEILRRAPIASLDPVSLSRLEARVPGWRSGAQRAEAPAVDLIEI